MDSAHIDAAPEIPVIVARCATGAIPGSKKHMVIQPCSFRQVGPAGDHETLVYGYFWQRIDLDPPHWICPDTPVRSQAGVVRSYRARRTR
jgi:hypothetical protein